MTASLELAVFAALFLLIGLVFDRTIGVQFTLPKLMWLRFGTAAIIAVWALRVIHGQTRSVPAVVLVPTILLAGWWVLVTPFAADVRTAINGMHGRYNGLIDEILLLVVFLVVASAGRTRAELRRLVLAFLIALIPVALYAAAQDFGLDPLVWPNARPGSTIGHPVPLAAIMALAIPFVLAFLMVETRTVMRIAWSALLLLFGFATAATLSRGPWLGLAAACAIVTIPAIRARIVNLKASALWWSIAGVASAGVLLADSTAVLHILRRLEQLAELAADPSFTGRFVFFDAAYRMMRAHPVAGVGLENFGLLYPQYRPIEPETVPPDSVPSMVHNTYIQSAATTGVIGLALGLVLSAALLFLLIRSCRVLAQRLGAARTNDHADAVAAVARDLMLGLAFIGALAGYLVQSLSGWEEISLSAFYWILAGAGVAFCSVEQPTPAGRFMDRFRIPMLMVASAAAAMAMFLGFDTARQIDIDRVFFQARLLDQERDWPLVQQQLEFGLAAAGNNAQYHDDAGLLYLKRVESRRDPAAYRRAAALFGESARLNRFNPYALIHRIDLETAGLIANIVQTASGEAQDAIARVTALDPNNATVYESIARLQQAAHDSEAASKAIDTAIRLRPHHPRYHVLRGDLRRSRGDRPDAIADYREEIPLLTPASAEWLNVEHRLMVTLEEAGRHEEVIAQGKIVTTTVNDDIAFTVLGLAYRSMDDRKNAFQAFAAAARINPANANATAGLREAEAALQRAPAADPKPLTGR